MRVFLESPRVTKMKNDTKALSFSVVLVDEDNNLGAVVGNFRLMDGVLNPPVSYSRKTHQYYPVAWLRQPVAEKLYAAIAETGWIGQHGLPALVEKARAIMPVLLTTEVARKVAPGIAAPGVA